MIKTLFHTSPIHGLVTINPRISNAYKELGPVVFATSLPQYAACFGTRWSDIDASISVVHGDKNDYPKETNISKIIFNVNDNVNLSKPCSMYSITGNFSYLDYEENVEYYARQACKVIDERVFVNMKQMLEFYGVKLKRK